MTPRSRRKARIGILEILHDEDKPRGLDAVYTRVFGRQYYSIMPQAVAAWCRRMGHHVTYATYFGQKKIERLVPPDLDLLFVSAFTKCSSLAYALSKLFRSTGTTTILGGPHGRAFAEDAVKYFDIVVSDCDETIIADVVGGHYPRGSIVRKNNTQLRIPLLAERFTDVRIAAFPAGRPHRLSMLALLSSTGCPYACDFCTDWNNPYQVRNADDLRADLDFAARECSGLLIAFHDPNFGVRFDDTLRVLEATPEGRTNPYIIESSLSILTPKRLERLASTGCAYLAPGVESWSAYGNKAGTGNRSGRSKLDEVAARFELISSHVKGLQANFLIGSDADASYEPIALTKEFISRFPSIFPQVNLPIAFGATPMRARLKADGRLLPLPPMFYSNPVLTQIPKHYDPLQLINYRIELAEAIIDRRLFMKRMTQSSSIAVRFVQLLFVLKTRSYLSQLKSFATALRTDQSLLAFHEGRQHCLPHYYLDRLDRRLGRFSELILDGERRALND